MPEQEHSRTLLIQMNRKKLKIGIGFTALLVIWAVSMYGLYLREKGYFIEAEEIRQYRSFIDFELPTQLNQYYKISVLDNTVGYYYTRLEPHEEDYYYNKHQELMFMLSDLGEMPLYFNMQTESSHNLDGSLMFQEGTLEVNEENIDFQGNVVNGSAVFDIDYRDRTYNREFELPDHYLTLDLFSPFNIDFSQFVLQETYKLETFFPHLVDFPQSLYLRLEEITEITHNDHREEVYLVYLFDENETFSSQLWVDKENQVLQQTFQNFVTIERINDEEHALLEEEFKNLKAGRSWQELPDLSPILEGEWWRGFPL